MIKESYTVPFHADLLRVPITWHTLKTSYIPLGFFLEKALKHLGFMIGHSILAVIPFTFLSSLTFRPFMHALKPYHEGIPLRFALFITTVMLILWLLNRLIHRKSEDRLKTFLHLLPAIYLATGYTAAGG